MVSKYQFKASDIYLPGTDIPKNRLGIDDAELLHEIETNLLIASYRIQVSELQPAIGEANKGDLAGVFVHKFKCNEQLMLLAYECEPSTRLLLLLGSHENFYRELKR